MLLGAEIGMSVLGVYWLITGKAKVGKTRQLEGTAVRLLGLILLFPIPLAIILGFGIGFLATAGALPHWLLDYTFIADVVSIVTVFIITTIYYSAIKGNATEINQAK